METRWLHLGLAKVKQIMYLTQYSLEALIIDYAKKNSFLPLSVHCFSTLCPWFIFTVVPWLCQQLDQDYHFLAPFHDTCRLHTSLEFHCILEEPCPN